MKLLTISLCLILSGCASKIQVWKKNKDNIFTPVEGLPFRTVESYVKHGYHNKHSKGKECEKTSFVKIIPLATGDLYYVNVDAKDFIKTEFSIKYNPNGSLSEVSMNSDPSSNAIEPLAGLITELLPFAGILPKLNTAPDDTSTTTPEGMPSKPPCDSGEVSVKYTSLEEWNKQVFPDS